MATQPETVIQAKIQAYLKGEGFWVMKIHGSSYQMTGVPDLLAVREGRAYFFEVKTPTGTTSKIQDYRIAELRRAGALAEVVRSVEEVKECLGRVQE